MANLAVTLKVLTLERSQMAGQVRTLGRSDQKEFARVHENGHPGQRDRESDRLRNRATGRGGSR